MKITSGKCIKTCAMVIAVCFFVQSVFPACVYAEESDREVSIDNRSDLTPRQQKKIQSYFEKARYYLGKNDFARAKKYTCRIQKIDEDNEQAKELLLSIEQTERAYERQQELIKRAEEDLRKKKQREKEIER
jgi:lipopolysaccharide biosynthesis regulator YciM